MANRVAAVVGVCTLALTVATVAHAQSGSPAPAAGQTSSAAAQQPAATTVDLRPATNTFFGDTGIWFVPTAEILPHGKWSASGYRRGTNFAQGYSNVGDFAGTFGVGVRDRAEIFGSLIFDTRIDRDLRPLFGVERDFGGIIDRYPQVSQYWTGDNIGDFYLGAKFNILSEYRQQGVAVAARAMVQFPTGDDDALGSGTDWTFDLVASKEGNRFVEVSGYLGWGFYSSAEGFDAPNGAFRYGAGAAFPSRSPLRVTGELTGRAPVDNEVTIQNPPLIGEDFSIAPIFSDVENLTRWTIGLTYQARNGFFIGGGLSANTPTIDRIPSRTAGNDDTESGDFWDWQVRIGYHPGVRVYVAPAPPPPPPPPPPPAPAAQHNLTVTAACNPNTVAPGATSNCTATVMSSINCAVTYRWTAPSGTLAMPAAAQTGWTAGQQEGTVPITITVTCPTDNRTATATANVQVVRPPVRQIVFEDVYFDFDRYSLRPEATRVLDEAVAALNQNPTLRITIEGHTCNIGTAEYNLALGERRGVAVRQYLQSRGIAADRMTNISYGEERPKFDNAREETRRLNRRAALVVRLQ